MEKKNVLIISPHPDDFEIGMGGTAAKLTAQGFNVVSLVVTDGRRSTSVSGLSEDEMAELRKVEVKAAAKILGIKDLILAGLHDVKGDENKKEMRQKLEEVITAYNPVEIFSTHPHIDKHPTHQTVSMVVVETLDSMTKNKPSPQKIWCYEVWTSFERYDRLEDVSDFIEKKTAAINAHKSQIQYKDYTGAMIGLNRYRAVFNNTGGVTNMKYAEVFIELSLTKK